MPNLKRFAVFAEKYGTVSNCWATRATQATPAQEPQKTAISKPPSVVAQPGDSRATQATPQPTDNHVTISVARVAQVLPKQVTERATPETKETCGFQGPVAHVAHENDEGLHRTGTERLGRSTAFVPIPEPGPGAEAQLWCDWYEERCAIREYEGEYPRAMAESITYREARNRWHLLHGQKPDLARCAGCGKLLSGRETLALPDGARVHADDDWPCLRAYGKHWQDEAVKALAGLGIMPPEKS